jgi:hypothetical protein
VTQEQLKENVRKQWASGNLLALQDLKLKVEWMIPWCAKWLHLEIKRFNYEEILNMAYGIAKWINNFFDFIHFADLSEEEQVEFKNLFQIADKALKSVEMIVDVEKLPCGEKIKIIISAKKRLKHFLND